MKGIDFMRGLGKAHLIRGSVRARCWGCALLTALLILAASGCGIRQEKFATPDDAAKALVLAIRSENEILVQRLLGRNAHKILLSGDDVADRSARDKFLKAYDEKHSIVAESDGTMTLQVGPNDWPLPIPIVNDRDDWRFDLRRGKEEIINRRVGKNELSVSQVCLAIVDAQREYIAADHDGDGVLEYAQKLISDPGMKNGLYWPTQEGEAPSPLGPLVAEATQEGYRGRRNEGEERQPYYGYYFKGLKSQGPNAAGGERDYFAGENLTDGFALIAWPARYGNSGVMSFMVNHQGVVFECDLGRRTHKIASSMTHFDPDEKWNPQ